MEDLSAQTATRFLLAPSTGGWISAYPSDHGQDVSLSAAIAARVPAPVLHLFVHDDGVFAYMLYDAGGLIDEYCSDPDYFEPSPPTRWQETAGRPEVLAALSRGADSTTLANVLKRSGGEKADPFRATLRLPHLAEALGIANVETSFAADHHPPGVLRGLAQRDNRGFRSQGSLPGEVTPNPLAPGASSIAFSIPPGRVGADSGKRQTAIEVAPSEARGAFGHHIGAFC